MTISLQNVFCQKSAWISHICTYVPYFLNLLPISLPIPHLSVDTEPLFEFPKTYSKFPLAVYFTHGDVSFHATLSIHLTLSSPLTVSISLFSVCFSAGGFFTPEAPRKPLSSFSFDMQILGPVCQGLGHDSSTYILCDLRKTLCFSLFTRSKRIILVPTLGLNELVWKAFRMVPSTLHYDHCQPSSYVSQAYYQNKYGLYYNQGSICTK